jgi:hypothetical protein
LTGKNKAAAVSAAAFDLALHYSLVRGHAL